MTEKGLFQRVTENPHLLWDVFGDKAETDWQLALQWGAFLVDTVPADLLGHFLCARASRHLGRAEAAECELKASIALLGSCSADDRSVFDELIANELLLSGAPPESQ